MATPSLSLAQRMGERGRRPGEETRLSRGEGEREPFFNAKTPRRKQSQRGLINQPSVAATESGLRWGDKYKLNLPRMG